MAAARSWLFLQTTPLVLLTGALAGVLSVPGRTWAQEQPVVLESSHLKVELRSDLQGIARLIDKRHGRDYLAAGDRPPGLYRLYFGPSFPKSRSSRLSDIVSRQVTRLEHGVRLTFEHQGTHPALVECVISAEPDQPSVRFSVSITNRSNQPLVAVDYPLLPCRSQLGEDSADDRLLYPQHEGILLCDPARKMKPGTSLAKAYPGFASAQLMYFFDAEGGVYCGAEDTQGGTKTPLVERQDDRLDITWRHEFPSERLGRTELGYDVVVSAGGPTWQEGADMYRAWAEREAPWCEKTIPAGATPDWLQQVNVFLNYQVSLEGDLSRAEQAAEWFRRYRNLLGAPVVACAFGWEQHGAWIGPDYFPPRGGEQYYRDLARYLAEQGDHMHVFTSGFRWGVRKTLRQTEQGEQQANATGGARLARQYTDYDGTARYFNHGSGGAVIDASGEALFRQRPWADNYLLCAGSSDMREIIGNCFATIYSYGIAGVDLDQDLGAGMSHCYSDRHGHPVGAGRWQYRTMYAFLEGVRMQARQGNPDSFIGVEEPCEVYIPVIDIVHGRTFTDTVWPAMGPGAVSVPLYIYLYHAYQLNYAGWIDRGFSPFGDPRIGIARATLYGMQPGVRIGRGSFEAEDGEPSAEMAMLIQAVHILRRCRDYLILGRMLHDPVISGSPALEIPADSQHPPLPLSWPAVQGTAWRADSGSVCYALANLSDTPHTIELLAQAYGSEVDTVRLTRIGSQGELVLRDATALPIRVQLVIQPWEICCVEQR